MADQPKLINIEKLSELTGISRHSLQRLARTKQLPSHRIGRRYLFNLEEVLEATRNAEGEENAPATEK